MLHREDKNAKRKKRHLRSRRHIKGTAERPRLNVFRSAGHIYAQIVNDEVGVTLVSASTLDKEIKATIVNGGNVEAAKVIGKAVAERAVANGIKKVVFDRGGYLYHGRIAALAEAAREAGLEF